MAEDLNAQNLEETKSIGKEAQEQVKGNESMNKLLKERLSLLDSVSKAQEIINNKLSAATELARDVKELDSMIYKEKQKEIAIRNQLSNYSQEEIDAVKKLQVSLIEKYKTEKAADEEAKKRAEELHKYNIQGKLAQLELDIKAYDDGKKSEEEILAFRQQRTKTLQDEYQQLMNNKMAADDAADAAREEVMNAQKLISPRQAGLLALQEAEDAQKKILKTLEKEKERRDEINNRIGIAGHLAKGSHSLLDKMGIASFGNMEELNKKMEKAAADGAGKWKIMGIVGSHAMKSIGEALNDPLVVITAFYKIFSTMIKGAVNYENHVAEAAKSLGTSVSSAKALYNSFEHIADQNAQLGMTGHQMMETYKGMNDQLGFMSSTNSEFLTTSTGLQRRLGITANDMANVALFSEKTKKSTADTYNTIIGTAKAQMGKLKFAMSEKQVMEGIGKISATVFANFKGNVAQMAAAVVKATKLGTTLDEINNAGKSLLDFEGSISKEFEAQLLTGKNINLSKAREYALTGKTDKLMDEITKNLGDQNSWNNMNVMQQQSLAEAMGMSKEQVDEMFKKQKLANLLGKDAGQDAATQYENLKKQGKSHAEIAELMGKDSAQQALQATTQEKMAAAQERLSAAFDKMMSALQPIIDKVTNWLTGTKDLEHTLQNVFKVLTGMGALFVAYKSYMLYTTTQSRIQEALEKKKTLELKLQTFENKKARIEKKMSEISDKTSLGYQKLKLQSQKIENNMTKVGSRMKAVQAAASVTAGSGYLGPLASIAGGLVLTWLMGLIASEGEGSATPPSMTATEPKIEPMNEKAEGVKTERSITRAREERPVQNFIRVEPVTGKAVAQQSSQEVFIGYQKLHS